MRYMCDRRERSPCALQVGTRTNAAQKARHCMRSCGRLRALASEMASCLPLACLPSAEITKQSTRLSTGAPLHSDRRARWMYKAQKVPGTVEGDRPRWEVSVASMGTKRKRPAVECAAPDCTRNRAERTDKVGGSVRGTDFCTKDLPQHDPEFWAVCGCKEPGCGSMNLKGKAYCEMHCLLRVPEYAAAFKCKVGECLRRIRNSSCEYCRSHMKELSPDDVHVEICNVENCTNQKATINHCAWHAYELEPDFRKQHQCVVSGCERRKRAGKYCESHAWVYDKHYRADHSCRVPDCTGRRVTEEYCDRHSFERIPAYQAKRVCTIESCELIKKTALYCKTHAFQLDAVYRGKHMCSVPDCEQLRVTESLCGIHAWKMDAAYRARNTCSIDGCGLRLKTVIHCAKHAFKLDAKYRASNTCGVDGCNSKLSTALYCAKHAFMLDDKYRAKNVCCYEGCLQPKKTAELCQAHAWHLDSSYRNANSCEVSGCAKVKLTKNYCRMHARQLDTAYAASHKCEVANCSSWKVTACGHCFHHAFINNETFRDKYTCSIEECTNWSKTVGGMCPTHAFLLDPIFAEENACKACGQKPRCSTTYGFRATEFCISCANTMDPQWTAKRAEAIQCATPGCCNRRSTRVVGDGIGTEFCLPCAIEYDASYYVLYLSETACDECMESRAYFEDHDGDEGIFCAKCFYLKYPEKRPQNYKCKEFSVMGFLINTGVFKEYCVSLDRPIKKDGSKFRPDLCVHTDTLVLTVEVDEYQHASYLPHMEAARTKQLLQDCDGKPLRIIRFNPDGYTDGEIEVASCWTRENGKTVLRPGKEKAWMKRLELLADRVRYYLELDGTTLSGASEEYLFFD